MKVKLLVSRSGLSGSFIPGDVIEVGGAEGKRMIDAGQAVTSTKKKERATNKTMKETRANPR